MKTILVYGDSNVYGEAAFHEHRLAYEERWVTQLQDMLGLDSYRVIPEGLSGRIAGDYKQNDTHSNGLRHFEAIYRSHAPVNILVVALGTNDLQPKYGQTAQMIADNLRSYYEATVRIGYDNESQKTPKILYLLPSPVRSSDYFAGANDKLEQLESIMTSIPSDQIRLRDVKLSEDGVHFDPNGHSLVAERVFMKINEMQS